MKQTFLVLFILGLGISSANASTLRVICNDRTTGAEVSINGKYKGECPIDVQVNEGKHNLKAVKKINGKNETFQEQVRIGDGVTKRIEVTFGASAGEAVTAIRIDQKAMAQQRYEAELAEYNRSIEACLPKHAVEERRLKQAVKNKHKELYAECLDERSEVISSLVRSGSRSLADARSLNCGDSSLDPENVGFDNDHLDVSKTDEYKEYRGSWGKDRWCERQFTKPTAP